MSHPDDEDEPLTRFLGTPLTPSAPPHEQTAAVIIRRRSKTRLVVVVVVLAAATLGAGTWLMR